MTRAALSTSITSIMIAQQTAMIAMLVRQLQYHLLQHKHYKKVCDFYL